MNIPKVPITREVVRTLWKFAQRKVPEEVMLTTVEMESRKQAWGGPYEVVSELFEKRRHERKVLQDPTREPWMDTSLGLFQILGENLCTLGYPHLHLWHEQLKAGQFWPPARDMEGATEIYVLAMMAAYDKHMAPLVVKYGIPHCFYHYNGSGAMADAYERKAIQFWNRVKQELGN